MYQLTEVDKCILLAIASGGIGGLIQAIIQDIVNQIKNHPKNNFVQKIKLYLSSCLTGSIFTGIFGFILFASDTNTPIENTKKYIIPYAIILLPSITLSTELLTNFVFRKQDN